MSDQKALILGGTKGLGWALAHDAMARGIRPIVAGRYPHHDIAVLPPGFDAAPLDITRPDIHWDMLLPQAAAPDLTRLFWVAGAWLNKRLADCNPSDILGMMNLHLTYPIQFLSMFHRVRLEARLPYRLIVIGSTSAFKMNEEETVYAASKAGQVAFARRFSVELAKELPGSKTLLVNPGRMNSGTQPATGSDDKKRLDVVEVSGLIWEHLDPQHALWSGRDFLEMNIHRQTGCGPLITYGAETPETP